MIALHRTRQALVEYAEAQTAAIVEDYSDRPVRGLQTGIRKLLRMLVVAVLGMFLVVAVVLLLVVGVNPQRTARIYSPQVVEQLKSQQLSFGNRSETWLCPCQQSQQAFSQFLPFKLLRNPSSEPTLLFLSIDTNAGAKSAIKTAQSDCEAYAKTCQRRRSLDNLGHDQIATACQLMLRATTSRQGTLVTLPYLSKPSTVWQAAANHAQDAIISNSAFQGMLVNADTAGIWWCIEDILYALVGTWFLASNSTQHFPSAEQFINMATSLSPAHMPFNQVFSFPPYVNDSSWPITPSYNAEFDQYLYVTPEVVPMLMFDWDAYVEGCSVPYCDVTKRTSISYRVFSTFSQIGGVLTIALLVTRVLLWPTVVWLVRIYEGRCAAANTTVDPIARQRAEGVQVNLVAGPLSV